MHTQRGFFYLAIFFTRYPVLQLFFDRFPSINFCEALITLSFRCVQPSQQQGLRIPSLSSFTVLTTCSFRVLSCFTNVTQHIHSFRASGVKLSQMPSARVSAESESRKSEGILCAVPLEIVFGVIRTVYTRQNSGGHLLCRLPPFQSGDLGGCEPAKNAVRMHFVTQEMVNEYLHPLIPSPSTRHGKEIHLASCSFPST